MAPGPRCLTLIQPLLDELSLRRIPPLSVHWLTFFSSHFKIMRASPRKLPASVGNIFITAGIRMILLALPVACWTKEGAFLSQDWWEPLPAQTSRQNKSNKTENLEPWWCCCVLTGTFSISGILEAQVTEINCLTCYIPRRVLQVSIFILPKVHHCISITLFTCCPSFQTLPFLIFCHEVCICLLANRTSCPAQKTFHFCER